METRAMPLKLKLAIAFAGSLIFGRAFSQKEQKTVMHSGILPRANHQA